MGQGLVWDVTAQSVSLNTGKPLAKARTERIDVRKNSMFTHCRTAREIYLNYENFWNRFPTTPRELVLIRKIVEVV